jgi:hypothetical protein
MKRFRAGSPGNPSETDNVRVSRDDTASAASHAGESGSKKRKRNRRKGVTDPPVSDCGFQDSGFIMGSMLAEELFT